ncbi:MAG: molecular chaperone DnaJ [Wolbachia sp.]|nr:molecular chaperone DnaJ [Wolbachia sp.]MDD9336473.1 molecular chaperone DnaJ [Wolbachia sp.]
MNRHLKLTSKEFSDDGSTFSILEIKAEQVIGKDYQGLSKFLKKQYGKLVLVNHPDKGGDKNRFDQIYKAYQELKKYIEPLESGNPCVKVDVYTEGDGHLTEREFHYRNKLFEKLNITQEEVVKKTFEEVISVLENKNCSFKQDFEKSNKLRGQIRKTFLDPSLSNWEKLIKSAELTSELNDQLEKPSMRLFNYVTPLKEKKNLVGEDKRALALKFIERKNTLLFVQAVSIILLALLTTITIGCYLSWWIIAFNIVTGKASNVLVNYYMEKYKNSEISTDEFISKMNYIQLVSKLLLNYPLAAFSVYLLETSFVSSGLTIGVVILTPLLLLAILTEVLAPVFSKGCKIYTEKHTRDLLEEDPRDRAQKETDLLKWYDPRWPLVLLIMPLVRKYFSGMASEFVERNLDEVNTNMSNVNTEQPPELEAIEFTQGSV